MNARTRTGLGLALLGVIACVAIGLLVFGRLSEGRLASDPSYALITSPMNGDILILGDPIYVEVRGALSRRNVGLIDLSVDGQPVQPEPEAGSEPGQIPVQCSSDEPEFCGLIEARRFWRPSAVGEHVLSLCIKSDGTSESTWEVCTDPVRVVVVDPTAQIVGAGIYNAEGEDTLQSIAEKFGLPPVMVAAVNPEIDPAGLLPKDTPINIPSDPSLAGLEPDAGSSASARVFKTVNMTVDVPIDRTYCYYSLGENYWTRMPAGPQSFAYPLNGQLDLTAHFRPITIPASGGSLWSVGDGVSAPWFIWAAARRPSLLLRMHTWQAIILR